MTTRPKRPRDPIALAKMIGDIATGHVEDSAHEVKDQARVASGRAGGLVGGPKRATALSATERSTIAKRAAHKRWGKV